jgi:hypothetical protein
MPYWRVRFWHARCRRDGIPHGMFCMGCCAALMLLRFAVAATDLRWVVALTVLVTSEKLLPGAKIWRLTIAVGLIAAAAGLVLPRLESGITQISASLRAPHPRHTFIAAAELAGYGLGKLVVRVLSPRLGDQQTSTILPADPGSRISLCARAASASGNSLLTTGRRVPFSRPAKRPA